MSSAFHMISSVSYPVLHTMIQASHKTSSDPHKKSSASRRKSSAYHKLSLAWLWEGLELGRVLMPHHRCQAPGTPGHHAGHWSGNSPGYRPEAPLSREAGAGKCQDAVTPEMASDLLEAGHNRSWRVEVASQIYLVTASDIHSEVCMASRWVEASLEALCSESEA